MKINSRQLWKYIFDLDDIKEIKFKIYKDDVYTGTIIKWDGENFWWEPGTFSTGSFFDPTCDFEIIEEK